MEVESNEEQSMVGIGGGGGDPDDNLRRKGKIKRRNICLGVIGIILVLAVILLILGLTVFKAKKPVTTINSVALQDLEFSLDMARLRVYLNVTVDVGLTIKNPNKVGFKYKNSSALLKYRGQDVGDVPVPAGKINSHQTLPMNLTVTVLADRLLGNSSLYSDALSGTLPFSTYIRISGKVRILIINIHPVSYSTCDFSISLSNRNISDLTCRYRTKL